MQSRLLIFKTFFLISLLLSFQACHREKCDYVSLRPEVKSLLFKQGSYWVYQDSASGLLDTFSITSVDNKSTLYPSGNSHVNPACEFVEYFISHSFSTYTKQIYKDYFSFDVIYRHTDSLSMSEFYYESSFGSGILDTSGRFTFYSKFNSFIVNGVSYNNVIAYKINAAKTDIIQFSTIYYHAINNGVIRFEVDSGNGKTGIWNLIEKNTKPY